MIKILLFISCSLLFLGNDCHLFSGYVGRKYVGPDDKNKAIFDECYSSWTHPKNVLENTRNNYVSSSNSVDIMRARRAITGFYCFGLKRAFVSDTNNDVWWSIDLIDTFKLKYILLVVPLNDNNSDSYFENVSIRFGNESQHGTNPEIITHTQPITDKYPVKLQPKNPISGRYLSFERSTGKLGIAELIVVKDI